MSISVFDHSYLSDLFSGADILPLFSGNSEITEMVRFEKELALAEGECGVIPMDHAVQIKTVCESFEPDMEALRQGTASDGVVVPELVRELRSLLPEEMKSSLHFGATSQDVIDTSLILRLSKALKKIEVRLAANVGAIEQLKYRFGENQINARTRLQVAYPFSASQRLNQWDGPLVDAVEQLDDLRGKLLRIQFAGAIGNLQDLGDKGPKVRALLAEKLDLKDPGGSWHTNRSSIQSLANWLHSITTALGKAGTDIALMAMNEVGEVRLAGAGGSSAMPHKQNPVKAETLITLAKYNATLGGGISVSSVHEFERSGSSWTLEWMLMPQMLAATYSSLNIAERLFEDIQELGAKSPR
ncbi:3-carboxy-cis,cis-muconate cycloisomerase [Sneathiella limimaris]|uniref:3-carboxy-cis,cis-muconate cycloisomerase n=1 Tax=Sneathiella limimaris TaxID=1964213 RepID=UPI001469D1B6|nr:3-carboxy-cis,cis-muconate cycloisomerase [Sneathiella limimaris]